MSRPRFWHSDTFRSIRWNAEEIVFAAKEAEAVKKLWPSADRVVRERHERMDKADGRPSKIFRSKGGKRLFEPGYIRQEQRYVFLSREPSSD